MTALTMPTLRWIGTGRVGTALATKSLYPTGPGRRPRRVSRSGRASSTPDATQLVWNRNDAVSGSHDLAEVIAGRECLLADAAGAPRVLVDSSTVSMEVSSTIREHAATRGTALLAASMSGDDVLSQRVWTRSAKCHAARAGHAASVHHGGEDRSFHPQHCDQGATHWSCRRLAGSV